MSRREWSFNEEAWNKLLATFSEDRDEAARLYEVLRTKLIKYFDWRRIPLSEDRADEVVNILIQEGHIPLTRMLAPGAMGESHQVGNDTTADGQAKNRRVVVRLLQNKAIAGV